MFERGMKLKQAVFLDRDGVINEVLSKRVKFVNRPEDFHLLPGVGDAVHLLNEAEYLVLVVTNQGGVGLGFMKESSLKEVHEEMKRDLARYNADITDIAYCPHRPDEGCQCRKPEAKMLFDLAKKHHIDLKRSYMVGDRAPDISAGRKAGTRTVLLSSQEEAKADKYFPDLLTFAKWLTG